MGILAEPSSWGFGYHAGPPSFLLFPSSCILSAIFTIKLCPWHLWAVATAWVLSPEEVGKLAVPVSSRQQVGPHPAGSKKGKTRLYLGPLLSLNILSFSGCSLGGGRALQKGEAEAQRWEVPSPLSPRESQVGSNPGILLPRS